MRKIDSENGNAAELNVQDEVTEVMDGGRKEKKWTVTHKEFISEHADPRPAILEGGIMPARGITVLAGQGGKGKTTLAAQLAINVTTGTEFLGIPTNKTPVLLCQAEGSRDDFRKRVITAQASLGVHQDLDIHYLNLGPIPTLGNGDDLIQAVKESGAGLTVLDTYGYFVDKVEENDNSSVKYNVFRPVMRLINETGSAVILVHHETKPNEGKEGRQKIRGASAFFDDCDTAIRLTQPNTKWSCDEDRILFFEKIRNGSPKKPMAVKYDSEAAIFRLSNVALPDDIQPPYELVIAFVEEADGEVKSADLINHVMAEATMKKRSAETLVNHAVKRGLIKKSRHGFYVAISEDATDPAI